MRSIAPRICASREIALQVLPESVAGDALVHHALGHQLESDAALDQLRDAGDG